MKLRIKGDSIRLRLSQTEVEEFASKGSVVDAIGFMNTTLTYELRLSAELSAVFENDKIIISIPNTIGAEWTKTDKVGVEGVLPLNEGKQLSLLIEKDFKCLTDRPQEDESDLYENPIKKHDC